MGIIRRSWLPRYLTSEVPSKHTEGRSGGLPFCNQHADPATAATQISEPGRNSTMLNLVGYAYQSGTIEFGAPENPWAFRRMADELKAGQENRIRFDPSLAPVVIQPSPNADEKQLPWLADAQQVIQSASIVYLQRTETALRFRQAIHQLTPHKQIVTIGSLAELQHFAATQLHCVHSLYAYRHDVFQFDIEKCIVRDRDLATEHSSFELSCRIKPRLSDGEDCVGFDATGTNSQGDLISWRTTVAENSIGKFAPAESRIKLLMTNYHHPFTFCVEYHPETKCRWYLFSPDIVKQWIDKSRKAKPQHTSKS